MTQLLMKKIKNGFTLVELLVVVAIIGILVAISLAAFSQTKKNARDLKRKSDLEQIRASIEVYRTDCKTYPATLTLGGVLEGPEGSACEGEIYIALVPNDPINSTYKYYYRFVSANQYLLCAYLETGTTPDSECGDNCGVSEAKECNYSVTNP